MQSQQMDNGFVCKNNETEPLRLLITQFLEKKDIIS